MQRLLSERKFPEFQTRKGVGDFAASALLRMARSMLIQLHPSRRASATNLPTAAVLGLTCQWWSGFMIGRRQRFSVAAKFQSPDTLKTAFEIQETIKC